MLKRPFSKRALEDKRQTELLQEAWEDRGKAYRYRKLHDDLQDQGETSCPNHVARLTRLAGIKAQIVYKPRSRRYGGKPSIIVDNTLDRQFDVPAPDTAWVTDITYTKTNEGFAYLAASLTFAHGVLWDGQSKTVNLPIWFYKPCSWPCGAGNLQGKF